MPDNSTSSETFRGDEPSTTTYGTEAGWVKPVDAAETAPSDAGDAASVEELDSGLPSFSIAFTPDTDEMGGDVWSDDGIVEADDGLYGSAQMDPGATLIALAAAGRNPADITLPTQGSEASGSGAQGSHEVPVSQVSPLLKKIQETQGMSSNIDNKKTMVVPTPRGGQHHYLYHRIDRDDHGFLRR